MLGGLVCQQLLESTGVYIGYNETDSLAGRWYIVVEGTPPTQRGELLGYRGGVNKRYPKSIVWVKRIGGMPGDTVAVAGRWFNINELALYAKPETSIGEPLDLGPTGVIPQDHYFVYTTHPDSYDSRYADIGWITPEQVIGRAYEIF
jgi:conjugal transfer pilin signal peptidase TrbI